MCLRVEKIAPIPPQTATIAHSAFPKGSLVMSMRDELGILYKDEQLKALFPSNEGQPAWSAWRLALITLMQYIEDLTDAQAAQAVRGRIDWKYALSLPLEDPGIDSSVRLGEMIGRDGYRLLEVIYDGDAPDWLAKLPGVEALRQVWLQQFHLDAQGLVHWREPNNSPPSAQLIHSPYDVEARFSRKRETQWVGYKVHLSEICASNAPHLITHVETTLATTTDVQVTDRIHQALEQRQLLPKTHLVDTGYVSAEHLLNTKVGFAHSTCRLCCDRSLCTHTKKQGRTITLRPQRQHHALQQARLTHTTEIFPHRYAQRAGVEGTLAQGIKAFGLRRCRYIGLRKTHLQHVLTATAMNIVRLVNWWQGVPFAATRCSRFAALAPPV